MFYSASKKGFYDPQIHGDTMPSDSVEISDETYRNLLIGQVAGATIVPDEAGLPTLRHVADDPDRDLVEAKERAILRMQDWLSKFLRQFTAGLPTEEVISWARKGEAARAFIVTAQPSPILLAECAVTGETPNELAAKIAVLADAYEVIIAKVTGLRRMTMLAIADAETPEAVEAALMDALATATTMATALGLEAPPTPQQPRGEPQ